MAGTAVVLLRVDNNRLRRRVADRHQQVEQAARLRDDNERVRQLLAQTQISDDAADRAIHDELIRVRLEAEGLERHARELHEQRRMQAVKDADDLANNHDPEKGLTRLENFQDVGQATPSTAFQTFVWASLKGEDGKLASMINISGEAREKLDAVIAGLPEDARARISTPEKLAALFFAVALTGRPSAQVTDVSFQDPQNAVVLVAGLTDRPQKIPLQLGVQGWQIQVPVTMATKLGEWVQSQPVPEKK